MLAHQIHFLFVLIKISPPSKTARPDIIKTENIINNFMLKHKKN